MIRAVLVWLCLAGMAAAQDLPALYDVTGVASDDVLNVRAAPTASAGIVGTLAPGATGVEVTAIDMTGGWARVNTGERSGWASFAFLTASPEGSFPAPSDFRCFGTEPFWSLDVTQNGLSRFDEPGIGPRWLLAGRVLGAEGAPGRFGLRAAAPEAGLALTLRRAECSDGMSDLLYGLDALLVLDGAASRVLSGCCSLQLE